MGKIYTEIDEKLGAWMERQHLFFVATAPLAEDGHINVSPKGDLRWFRILGPREVAYLDFVGSGAETIAHARENGRIVVMFCAFDGPPRIVRLHGRASVALPDDPGFEELARAVRPAGARGALGDPRRGRPHRRLVRLRRAADALRRASARSTTTGSTSKARDGGFDEYIAEKNAESIDGLPAI